MPDGTGGAGGRSSDPRPSRGRAVSSRRGKTGVRGTGTVRHRRTQGRGRNNRGSTLAAPAPPRVAEVDGTNTVERARSEVLIVPLEEDVEGPWGAGARDEADCRSASLAVEICNVTLVCTGGGDNRRRGRGLGGRLRYR